MIVEEDVKREQERIAQCAQERTMPKICVSEFRKEYTSMTREPVVAVEKMSFGMDYGDCFVLLGVNGSGKSTTFKCLTNEYSPTSGSLMINGLDVQRNFTQVRSMIGYCPQYDAIFEWMSVEEHLWFYVKLKGIPEAMRSEMIE